MQQGMQHKVCLVTGATQGIGKVTALELARQGARVAIVGRDRQRTAAVLSELRTQSGNPDVEAFIADFGAQEQVRRLAEELRSRYDRLDVLVNNAGGVFPDSRSHEGIELTFAVNHLGYFLLTNLLLNMLCQSAPARIVNVSSDAHRRGSMDFASIHGSRRYSMMKAYSQSKLANVLFTYELSRRLQGTGVTANAVHPGVVATGFGGQAGLVGWFYRTFGRFMLTPEQGADTLIYLAASPEVEGVTGKYYVKRRSVPSSPISYDQAVAARLWAESAALTGLNP